MQAGYRMARADHPAEQALLVDVPAELADAAAPSEVATVPIGPRRIVQMGPQVALIGADVAVVVGLAEELEEGGVVRQMARGGDLEAVQRDVVLVEVDCGDPSGIGCQIAQDVAPAGRDGDDMIARPKPERFHVDHRVFPDLRIDQAREHAREQPFLEPRAAEGAVSGDGTCQVLMRCPTRLARRHRHVSLPIRKCIRSG